MMRAESYMHEQHAPCPSTATTTIFTACKIARRYGSVPTLRQLRDDFGMSEATAYRWRSAMRAAGWPEREP